METISDIAGVRIGVAAADIRYQGRDDLVLIELADHATTAAVFTQNAFAAAPVTVAKEHLADTQPRYLLINAGNANAGTGARGQKDAQACCLKVAELAGCTAEAVLPFSTGVIGEYLPMDRMFAGIEQAFGTLAENQWQAAAAAIMTTDTKQKIVSETVSSKDRWYSITGIAKGAGMICPNMATMLSFITTDVAIEQSLLADALGEAVAVSFNTITVDGDTSTNDACVVCATGQSDAPAIEKKDERWAGFRDALTKNCQRLAEMIVRDAEGATKFIRIAVMGGKTHDECKRVAYTIAHSPLVKTAFYGQDPNWGRILAAVGRSQVANLAIDAVEIWLDEVLIAAHGGRAEQYTEALGAAVMSNNDIHLTIKLGRGDQNCEVLTSDLSNEYVNINADYRT